MRTLRKPVLTLVLLVIAMVLFSGCMPSGTVADTDSFFSRSKYTGICYEIVLSGGYYAGLSAVDDKYCVRRVDGAM